MADDIKKVPKRATSPEERLVTRQTRAIATLLTAADIKSAARAANVGERTLKRWLAEDKTFQEALRAAEGQAVANAVRRLSGTAEHAVSVVLTVMASKGNPASVRLRAATAVLDQLVKMKQFADLEARVTALEEALSSQENDA